MAYYADVADVKLEAFIADPVNDKKKKKKKLQHI
jgi:hypothetical protein